MGTVLILDRLKRRFLKALNKRRVLDEIKVRLSGTNAFLKNYAIFGVWKISERKIKPRKIKRH